MHYLSVHCQFFQPTAVPPGPSGAEENPDGTGELQGMDPSQAGVHHGMQVASTEAFRPVPQLLLRRVTGDKYSVSCPA